MTSVDHEVVGLEGRGMGLVIVGLVFAATAAATVAGRILSRVTTKRMLGNDDYIMVASLVGYLAILYTRQSVIFRCMC